MAAEFKVTINGTITGLGEETELTNSFTHGTAPVAIHRITQVIITDAQVMFSSGASGVSPFPVAVSAVYGIMVEPVTGGCYVGINTTSAVSTKAQFMISAGGSAYFPINKGNDFAAVMSAWMHPVASTATVQVLLVASA